MPLGIKKVRNPIWQKKDTDTKKAAFHLIQFEKTLYSDKASNKRKKDEQIVKYDSNTNLNIKPSKKQRKDNLTYDELDCKSELSEEKEKLKTKNCVRKAKKSRKIELNHTNDIQILSKNIECKIKTPTLDEWQVTEHVDQCTLPMPISQNNTFIKKTAQKPIIKTILENNITHKNQTVLRNVSITFKNMICI